MQQQGPTEEKNTSVTQPLCLVSVARVHVHSLYAQGSYSFSGRSPKEQEVQETKQGLHVAIQACDLVGLVALLEDLDVTLLECCAVLSRSVMSNSL